MAKSKVTFDPAVTFDTVRKIGLTFPGVAEGMTYGQPALKVHGKLLACIPANKAAEPNSLGVRIDFETRAELIAAAPDIYYAPDHYLNYPMMLVRLARIDEGTLRDLLGMSYKYVVSHSKTKPTVKTTPRKKANR